MPTHRRVCDQGHLPFLPSHHRTRPYMSPSNRCTLPPFHLLILPSTLSFQSTPRIVSVVSRPRGTYHRWYTSHAQYTGPLARDNHPPYSRLHTCPDPRARPPFSHLSPNIPSPAAKGHHDSDASHSGIQPICDSADTFCIRRFEALACSISLVPPRRSLAGLCCPRGDCRIRVRCLNTRRL